MWQAASAAAISGAELVQAQAGEARLDRQQAAAIQAETSTQPARSAPSAARSGGAACPRTSAAARARKRVTISRAAAASGRADLGLDAGAEGLGGAAAVAQQVAVQEVLRLHPRRALVDGDDAGVADELLERPVAGVAGAAENEDRVGGDGLGGLGREVLGERQEQRRDEARPPRRPPRRGRG